MLVEGEDRVDRVARRPGDARDDRTLLAEKCVEERALADVGPPDDRERELGLLIDCLALRRQTLDDRVQQVAGSFTVEGRDEDRFAEAQPRELAVDLRFDALGLGLVGDEDDGPLRSPHDCDDVLVER